MRGALLIRRPTTNQGTFGHFEAEGLICFSGELPWRDNAAGVSCVPEGQYKAIWAMSPRLKRATYRLLDVPGRAGCLIHSANLMGDKALGFVAQLEGCIALGEALGSIKGQSALLRSKPAVRRFEDHMGREPFILEIRNA